MKTAINNASGISATRESNTLIPALLLLPTANSAGISVRIGVIEMAKNI